MERNRCTMGLNIPPLPIASVEKKERDATRPDFKFDCRRRRGSTRTLFWATDSFSSTSEIVAGRWNRSSASGRYRNFSRKLPLSARMGVPIRTFGSILRTNTTLVASSALERIIALQKGVSHFRRRQPESGGQECVNGARRGAPVSKIASDAVILEKCRERC